MEIRETYEQKKMKLLTFNDQNVKCMNYNFIP